MPAAARRAARFPLSPPTLSLIHIYQLGDMRRQFDAGPLGVSPELVKLLKDWMTTHILQCDHGYAELAAQKSQRLMACLLYTSRCV